MLAIPASFLLYCVVKEHEKFTVSTLEFLCRFADNR